MFPGRRKSDLSETRVQGLLDQVDRPEDVQVNDDDDSGDGDAENSRSARCAERDGLQRRPDGHEPIGADANDQPRAEMERDEQQVHQSTTGEARRMQPLYAGDEPQPRLERADVEDDRVDDGQHQQVAVDGRRRRPAPAGSSRWTSTTANTSR